MGWIQDITKPKKRSWEEFYRNRWQYDKTVRSTHGNNCTGGCSWMVYVKDGVITWELQALDYPKLDQELPPYEPRGCQRGISASWYVYSPVRIKYPYTRGVLLDAWKEARAKHQDPVDAWASIVENAELHKKIKWSRGKGGFRRVDWDLATDIVTAAQMYTIKKWGPDRNMSFSVIPAMSMISYAAGARYHQLMGGVSMSFYDYYTDLPPASPEIWGEQTDVSESADWYHAGFVVIMGACLNMTRTADAHFISEMKYSGSKVVVLSPDFSQVTKFADLWVPLQTGSDGALWMAINHVIIKEFYVDRQVKYFTNYVKNYTDMPFLVKLDKGKNGGYEQGRLLRASEISGYDGEEHADWKFMMWDTKSKSVKMPNGTQGFRYAAHDSKAHGKWNTLLEDAKTGEDIDPALSFLEYKDDVAELNIYELDTGDVYKRQVPVKKIKTKSGEEALCTTIFDMNCAQLGVARSGLSGDYCRDYNDDKGFSPAWQEKYTGIGRDTIIQIAREFASTAEHTTGRSMVICGASINHWYHADLIYRAFINALMLCGCEGRNGGGMNHYVGQERLAPFDAWGQIALALDWARPPRLQNTPSYWYIHTQQWKYDSAITDYHNVPDKNKLEYQHCADYNVRAVRMGHLPWYPQLNVSSLKLAEDAQRSGAKTDEEIVKYVVQQIKSGNVKFAVDDPDAPENWPRVWQIWRANALGSSARGQEYFFKFLLGTHHNMDCNEVAKPYVKEMQYRESPLGKIDLICDLNMRMNTTPTYSDIVLPAAHWYEKEDINTTDLHSYIVPMGAAVPPNWEAKSDWDAFKYMSAKLSKLAEKHMPNKVKDVVITPLMHDTTGNIAQPALKGVGAEDWKNGKVEPIPGKTMPNITVIERDYKNINNRYRSFGPLIRGKYGFHGIMLDGKELYDKYKGLRHIETHSFDGESYIALNEAKEAANVTMAFSGLTNGEVCYRQWKIEEHHTGLHGAAYKKARKVAKETLCNPADFAEITPNPDGLADELAGPERNVEMTYDDIAAQPRRWLTSPLWSGDVRRGRSYTGWTIQLEHRVPWRTLTGRQHFYLDHPMFLDFGEGLCTHKYKLDPNKMNELNKSDKTNALQLNYITPHGKWQIHSTHYDNLRMLTLSRGGNVVWINDAQAESVGIKDNDWVEAYNDNGVFVCRANVSARIPKGTAFAYHSMERTVNIPNAQMRNQIRGGFHNSLTRQRLKPTLMAGGYGQFAYGFNSWGPIPIIRDTTVLVRRMPDQNVKWD